MKELWNEAIKYLTEQGVSRGVAITYIIVGIAIVVMALVALVMRIIVVIRYYQGNHTKTKGGRTSFQAAEQALRELGITDVRVEKAGWLRAFFIGNSYSVRRKTIYLRPSIANKDSITAVCLAVQKVALAKMDKDGDKTVRVRNGSQVLGLIGPIMIVPIVLLGFVIDFLLFRKFGAFSIAGIVVGFIFVIAGLVEMLLNLPVEKKANTKALELLEKLNMLDKEEIAIAKKVFSAYIVAYVCEFIVAILRIIQLALEIVMNAQISSKK